MHPIYSINGHLLNTVSEVRDFGVIVDSTLKFDKHISLIVCEAQQRAGLIMVALWNRANHYIFMLWFVLLLSFFPRLISAAADWMSAILPHMVWP